MNLRFVYPLWLREKIGSRFRAALMRRVRSTQAELCFAPGVFLELSPADVGHQSILLNGFYERALSRHICQLARKGGMLVDVGANYGYFTLLWLAQQAANSGVAFEAAPFNQAALKNNIRRNGFAERAQLVAQALSDQTGQVLFDCHDSDGQTGWGGIARHSTAQTIAVPTTTLDAFWQAHYPGQMIEVLKIDVEGADTLVLKGAEHLLSERRIRHIFFEENRPRMALLGIDPEQAPALLRRHGYRLSSIAPGEYHARL